MTNDLASSYPTGTYLEGNFVTDYTTNYLLFDRNIVRKYGDRGIEVDSDATIADVANDWLQDVNSIVFSHLSDWAKMFSASIKDYEPLWNVDGTVVTTYGDTDKSDIMGAKHRESDFAARTDGSDIYHTTYPDTTERKTDRTSNSIGAHKDKFDENTYTDRHTEEEHEVTEVRQGNIGVTETTTLIKHSYELYNTYNFYDVIFKFMIKEMGVIYYDWH